MIFGFIMAILVAPLSKAYAMEHVSQLKGISKEVIGPVAIENSYLAKFKWDRFSDSDVSQSENEEYFYVSYSSSECDSDSSEEQYYDERCKADDLLDLEEREQFYSDLYSDKEKNLITDDFSDHVPTSFDFKAARQIKRERDLKKDKPYRTVYQGLAKEAPAKSRKERRALYEQACGDSISQKISCRNILKIKRTHALSKRDEKKLIKAFQRALKRWNKEQQKRKSLDDFEHPPILDRSIFPSNGWQPDSPEVFQDKRHNDAHRFYRAPLVSKRPKINQKRQNSYEATQVISLDIQPNLVTPFILTFSFPYWGN